MRRPPVGSVWASIHRPAMDDRHDALVIGHGDDALGEGVVIVCGCIWSPSPCPAWDIEDVTDGYSVADFHKHFVRVA